MRSFLGSFRCRLVDLFGLVAVKGALQTIALHVIFLAHLKEKSIKVKEKRIKIESDKQNSSHLINIDSTTLKDSMSQPLVLQQHLE